jgi:hypothetical protein
VKTLSEAGRRLPSSLFIVSDACIRVEEKNAPEDLVDYVPLDDLALVVVDDVGHMVLDDGCQGVAVGDRVDPSRHLLVPEESVTTHDLSILLGKGDDLVSVAVAELSAGCYM